MGIREYAVLDGAARDRYLRQLVGLRLALTVVGVLVATGFTAATGAETVVVQGTFITGVGLLLTLTQQTYMVSLSARLKLGWVSALELLKHATISVSMIALVIAGASLLPFFLTSVFGGLVMLAARCSCCAARRRCCRPSTSASGSGCCARSRRSRSPPRSGSSTSGSRSSS